MAIVTAVRETDRSVQIGADEMGSMFWSEYEDGFLMCRLSVDFYVEKMLIVVARLRDVWSELSFHSGYLPLKDIVDTVAVDKGEKSFDDLSRAGLTIVICFVQIEPGFVVVNVGLSKVETLEEVK